MFTVAALGDPDWKAAVKALQVPLAAKLALVAHEVGREVVARLKSLSAETRGWQKRTGALEESYGYEVAEIENGAVLTLKVDAPHAIPLEARDGLFVLNGVADPGGPLDKAIVAAVREIVPDWQVVLRMD